MKLSELLAALLEKHVWRQFEDPEITSLRYDSRAVQPGDVFVAINGFHTDGHLFVRQAVAQGAAAVVCEEGAAESPLPLANAGRTAQVAVPDSRRALGRLSAALAGYPSRRLCVVGVTGTDGKTTTSFLINAVLEQAGFRTGLLGTVHFKVGEQWLANDTRQTTPEAPEIQQMLARMVESQVQVAILESTSHALALHRVTDCDFDVAVFTNLTSDHLDFHGSRDQYLQDKARLFHLLSSSVDKGRPKCSILNADDPASAVMRQAWLTSVITYGLSPEADVRAGNLTLTGQGTTGTLITASESVPFQLRLPGLFNVYNALAAVAVGLSQGIDLPAISTSLAAFAGVPGRMEAIDCGQPFTVIVDYAHTADSLRKVLDTVRPLTKGRIILLFGCAGERDRSKRPVMGQVAAERVDFCVLTNEDPRLEDPLQILAEIEQGAKVAGKEEGNDYLKIVDRSQAIRAAFGRAQAGDLVLLTGKGHEGSIIVGQEKLPWDDRRVAREILAELGFACRRLQ